MNWRLQSGHLAWLNNMLANRRTRFTTWAIPAIYAASAVVAGLTFSRIERYLLPDLVSTLSVSAATAVYSAVASGMIALTGIVFSLVFVMVQFSATAYSPRLVIWIARDPIMSHALGVFVATFLYAIAALAGIDRGASGKVPFISGWLVIGLLVASVALFISLVQRITLLQVNRMLVFTGDQGRQVIDTTYPLTQAAIAVDVLDQYRTLPKTQSVIHNGRPRSIQALDLVKLVKLAETSRGVIECALAIGDTVIDSMPLFHIYGFSRPIDEHVLRKAIALGAERTFEQDPKYAIRLLVDIAIRALSPAINDPTTAVQALDQIQDLLVRLSQRRFESGAFFDSGGKLRVVVPFATWEDLLGLAFEEICACGAGSMQVMRRMNALLIDLESCVTEERRPAIIFWQSRLKASIARSFASTEERAAALAADRQGLGGPKVEEK